MPDTNPKTNRSIRGFSLIEVLIVMAIVGILTAVALPQMLVQRRLTRSTAVTREILTQMRYARQLAMTQFGATVPPACVPPAVCVAPVHVAFTFQYDDVTKQINIIGPIPAGAVALADPTYPYNGGIDPLKPVVKDSLTQAGLATGEISYGVPAIFTGLPAALGDGVSMTPEIITSSSNQLNITFQPDGSVIDLNGLPQERAMFIYNNKAAQGTASAISVIGASGRVKVWRYSANANIYVE